MFNAFTALSEIHDWLGDYVLSCVDIGDLVKYDAGNIYQ